MNHQPVVNLQTSANRVQYLRILGLNNTATVNDIEKAYNYLVADIRPSEGAIHSKVSKAKQLLAEVEMAYKALAA